MKKIALLTFMLFLHVAILFAQAPMPNPIISGKGSISGIIIDGDSKKPMEYANAVVFKLPDSTMVTGTVSDVNGKFSLSNLPYGNYYLVLNFIGYKKQKHEGIVISDKNANYNVGEIVLSVISNTLDNVVVNAERNQIDFKIDKKVINVSQMPNAAGGTAIDVLKNVPTVNVDNDGNVSVRGSGNFTVLVDGKPSVMAANDVLKQIPANLIENIEVITNPSAKYDPEGTSGIINIIMKKGVGGGFNGIMNAMAGTGDRYSGDFLFNFKKEKFNYFIGADARRNAFRSEGEGLNEALAIGSLNRQFEMDRNISFVNGSIKTGFDYYINKIHTLSFSTQVGKFQVSRDSKEFSHLYDNTQNNYTLAFADNGTDAYFGSGSLNYTAKINEQGHQLAAMAYYSLNDGKDNQLNENFLSDQNWNFIGMDNSNSNAKKSTARSEIRFKIDYTLPIGKNKIELGHQTTLRPMNQDYVYNDYDMATNTWVYNSVNSSKFDFYRNVYAIYGTYSGAIKEIQYQVGLRGEYMDRQISVLDGATKYNLSRYDIYPSFSLSKNIGKSHQLQASYSKRVNQPGEFMLIPLPMFSSKYIEGRGNPNLLPEFVNSYELNYMNKFSKGYVSVSAYYRVTNNSFSMFLYNEGEKTIQTSANLKSYKSQGVDITSNLDLFKWWNVFANLSVYNYDLSADNLSDAIPSSTNNVNLRLNSTFRLKSFTTITINGMYNSPNWMPQGQVAEMFMLNFSIKQELLKRKATVVLNINDPFQLQKFQVDLKSDAMRGYMIQRNEAPVIQLSFSYRFNNYKSQQRGDDMQREMNQGGGIF